MLCDDCQKRQASVHITQIINNQKITKQLCTVCAKNYGDLGINFDSTFSVHDLLKSMFSHSVSSEVMGKNVVCPECSMTYSDFSRSGKIGCSKCLETFGPRVEPLFRRIHGATRHTGKIPARTGIDLKRKQNMINLRKTLEKHIINEEYELAAKVRDEIRLLEKELGLKE